jgi:hypothetical protein
LHSQTFVENAFDKPINLHDSWHFNFECPLRLMEAGEAQTHSAHRKRLQRHAILGAQEMVHIKQRQTLALALGGA